MEIGFLLLSVSVIVIIGLFRDDTHSPNLNYDFENDEFIR